MFQWMLLIIYGGVLPCQTECRRFAIQRPLPQEEEAQEEETVNYYAAEPQEEQGQVVLVSSADRYNGLYGQPQASARVAQDNYVSRAPTKTQIAARTKETAKSPPVQTIRNYNKVNDDGSFTFGYEAADGSFKEETRGKSSILVLHELSKEIDNYNIKIIGNKFYCVIAKITIARHNSQTFHFESITNMYF